MSTYYKHKRTASVDIPYSFTCEQCMKDSGTLSATIEVDATINSNHRELEANKDEKLKNLSFICIPFILAAIVISLFNIGKVRQPLSFLLLAIGLIALAISNFIRSKIISKSCSCKDCLHQSKSSFKYSILYGIASLGFLGTFIYYIAV